MGLSAYGTYMEGMALVDSLLDQSELATMTASDIDLQAQHTKQATSYNDRLLRVAGLGIEGQIVAETAKAGLATSGSALHFVKANARKVEIEAAMNKEQGILAYNRYTNAAQMARQQAEDLHNQASKGKTGTIIKTIASFF
jgi:hypothetical protein